MKAKRFITAATVLALTLCLLAGCSSNKPSEPETPPEAVEPVIPPENGAAQDKTLDALVGAIGKTDAQAQDELGEGTLLKAADGTAIGREYAAMQVLGREAVVSLLLDESGAAMASVNVVFSGASYDEVREGLTEAFGEPANERNNEESGGKTAHFTSNKTNVELLDAYGTVSVQISAI